MGNLRSEQPEHREAIDELLADVEAAFTGPSFWLPFTERCHAAEIPRVSEWLNSTGRIVAEQFERRGPALEATCRQAAVNLAAGRDPQADPRLDQATRVRAEEPRAHQPDADAHAATRQPPRRPERLRPPHPRAGSRPTRAARLARRAVVDASGAPRCDKHTAASRCAF